MSVAPIPPDSVLVHIGPHKTGTTAIQGAFHHAREALERQGVHYAGNDRQPMRAAISVAGREAMIGEPVPENVNWERLVTEVTAAAATRVMVSSEFLADCDDDAAARVVRELGSNVHVVVTLRPLHKILPSQWQQYVQNGMRESYDGWLEAQFRDPPSTALTPSFWRRHRHDRLVERWGRAAGADHVTVVVVDETDRAMVLRAFESLLALAGGTLEHEREDPVNRSLTFGEAEMLRAINRTFKAEGWPPAAYAELLRYGAIERLKLAMPNPPSGEQITTPDWAVARAVELGAAFAAAIDALRVHVIGDLSVLGSTAADPRRVRSGAPDNLALSPTTAAEAVLGVMIGSGDVATDPLVKDRRVRDVGSLRLLRLVAGRLVRRTLRTTGIRSRR